MKPSLHLQVKSPSEALHVVEVSSQGLFSHSFVAVIERKEDKEIRKGTEKVKISKNIFKKSKEM